MVIPKRTSYLSLLLILLCTSYPHLIRAQGESLPELTVCSPEGVILCSELFRLCVVVDGGEETCGPCQVDYVEFPQEAVTSIEDSETTQVELEALYTCLEIDKVPALFVSRLAPIYTDMEDLDDSKRREALLRSAQIVSEFNRGTLNNTVELALNQFAADTQADASGLLGYQQPDEGAPTGSDNVFVPDEDRPISRKVDWREAGAVTRVKNQGRCGCCWAIATVGALEGAAAIASNLTWLKTLSHQQFISCDKAHKGCNGGFPASAFDYADDRGVAAWPDYPYTDGQTGETTKECDLKGKPIEVEAGEGYKVNYYGEVGDTNYTVRVERLKHALALGPVTVSIKANCPRLMLYRKGVLTMDGECECGPEDDPCHDHSILMVGYNDIAPVPYWILKNSWGFLWGEGGYFRVAQLNPLATEDSWGLFGVLGEGIIPKDVFNSTGKTFDQNERRPTWMKLMIACIVILGVCLLALIFLYVKEHCFDNKEGKP